MMFFRASWCWCVVPLLTAGCVRYDPMPLNSRSVQKALAPTPEDQLQARASEIRHPLLRPVRIDLQHGLTPDSAAVMAVVVNPSLRGQRDRDALASAQLFQAGLLPNPSLDFTLDPVTGGNTQGAVTAYNVGVSWEVTSLITHEAKVAAARAASQSIRLDVAWQEWQFAQAARKAVYDLIALQAQRNQAQAVDRRLAENTDLIRRAVDTHQRTLLDLAAAEAASQKAHSDFLAAQRDFRHQQLALNQALGLPSSASVRIAETPLPDRLDIPSEQDLLSNLEQRRLDLLGLRRGYDSQEKTLRAAVLAQFPKIVLGVHQASDNTGVISTGFGITMDLPIFDQNQGNIRIQKVTRQQLFDEYVSRVFEARALVAQTLADIQSLSEQIAAAQQAIPALGRLVQTYRQAVEQHNADVLSYYNAENDLAQKRIDLFKLKQQLMDNKIALEIASGCYLPDSESRPATQPMEVDR